MSEETAPYPAPSLAQSDEAESGEVEAVLAWSETDEDQATTVEPDRQPLPRSLVVLLTGVVVCAIGLVAFVVGEYEVSISHPQRAHPQQARNQPALGELAPSAPNPAAVGQAPVAPAPQPQSASVQHPTGATPPNAEQTFSTLLSRDGFVVRQPNQAVAQAQASCAYLAQGGTMGGLIDGTAAKSPGATRQQDTQVTRDGVDAYCPQYDKK